MSNEESLSSPRNERITSIVILSASTLNIHADNDENYFDNSNNDDDMLQKKRVKDKTNNSWLKKNKNLEDTI